MATFAYIVWGKDDKKVDTRPIREITLNQTSLRTLNSASASVRSARVRRASGPEVLLGATHWVLDVSLFPRTLD